MAIGKSRSISPRDQVVVILDDQMVNLEATKLLLVGFGFQGEIKLFNSSSAAIDFIMAFTIEHKSLRTIDLLITEFSMPDLSGIEVIKEIETFLEMMISKNDKTL